MRRFKELFKTLDRTTRTAEKTAALMAFFQNATAEEASHGIHALLGKRDDAPASTTKMKQAVKAVTGVADWLYQRCYDDVGDTAETIALLLPPSREESTLSIVDWYKELRRLDRAKSYQKRIILEEWYEEHDPETVFLVNKLITGAFRVGVSTNTVVKALADQTGVDVDVLKHRLIGDWEPSGAFFDSLQSEPSGDELKKKPYPFFLCYPVDTPEEELGPAENFAFEWKYDGIRAQVIVRDDVFLWSRNGEPLNKTFPELRSEGERLREGVVLDGEILAYDDSPLPFQALQRRLGRSNPSEQLRNDVPVAFKAYDVLEHDGEDLRDEELHERRGVLESIQLPDKFSVAEQQWFSSWEEAESALSGSRSHGVEGFMVKHVRSAYYAGRRKQGWWKWKLDPFTLDVVLLYAQTGHGERSGLYTDYTFGVWDDDDLVPIAKAYSGLEDDVFEELDTWIRGQTVEQFGPVREVAKEQVFEIAFQGIYRNPSKKSGFATRFPRMVRWRRDKPVEEADTVDRCAELVETYE